MQMLSDAMKRYGGTLEQLLLRTMVKSGVVEEDTLRDALEDAIEDTEGEFDASELSEKFCLMSVGQSLLGLEMEEVNNKRIPFQ